MIRKQNALTPRTMAVLILLLSSLMLFGCAKKQTRAGGTVSIATPDFFGIGEDLAYQLSHNLRRPLNNQQRVIMTTFVDIDDLYRTSRFGRTLTESLATRLFHKGFGVVEVRKSSELLIRNSTGELVLTRDAAFIAKEFSAEAVMAGTYSLTPDTVIVNVKLLASDTQEVLSVAGMELQRSDTINYLLLDASGSGGFGVSGYER